MSPANCLRCGSPPGIGFHICPSNTFVVNPELFSEYLRNLNPLDKLPASDFLKIYGEDTDAMMERAQGLLDAADKEYFDGPLTYRVELQEVSNLGFQGAMDLRAVEVGGPFDDGLGKALDFLKSSTLPPLSLNKDQVYFCRPVSLNNEGRRYVWSTHRLYFQDDWKMTSWP